MTNKLEQAARALLAHWDTPAWKYLKPTGDLMADLREALVEQPKQEPVAWMVTSEGLDGTPKTYPLTGRFKDVCDMCDFGDPIPLYAAPVRTKDLTDDELADTCGWKLGDPMYKWVVDIGRWAIAADREKNKCQ